jgi:hypothetical protein
MHCPQLLEIGNRQPVESLGRPVVIDHPVLHQLINLIVSQFLMHLSQSSSVLLSLLNFLFLLYYLCLELLALLFGQ